MLETNRQSSPGSHVRLQRLVHHHRAEVGAADADVDDGADRLAGDALPLAGADLVGERVDLLEHRVHVVVDVLAVHDERRAPRPRGAAQRGVQHGAVLGDVDVLAGEHGLAPLGQVDLARPARTSAARISSVTQVLGQVDVQVGGLEGIPRRALRVGLEGRPQVRYAVACQRCQLRPGLRRRRVDRCSHVNSPLWSHPAVRRPGGSGCTAARWVRLSGGMDHPQPRLGVLLR